MPERQSSPKNKVGLHGWRAFLVVTGSGLAAGVLVVAIIVGVLRLAVSTLEGGVEQPQSDGPAPTRGPVTTLEPGSFDLCESLENMQAFSAVAPARADGGESFVDTAEASPGLAMRTIENTCIWDVQVGGLVPSQFTLTYTSYISNGGDSAVQRASGRFDRGHDEISGDLASVSSSGNLGVLDEGSHYAYGTDGGHEQLSYIGLVKTSVFTVDLVNTEPTSEYEADLEAEYKALVIELLPEIRVRLNRVIPD
ncbi:hypothetical protein FZ103_01095 [Streptomonospora sp. PA3]|uniref:hypothetical protein n=1 Tax=Streptomonospora sp. PA3 TaxID=2607326 RepID=UPI0012DE5F32|nr:hypothetical protein [Streptomonospora sp. PA3]MUL39787.1 hypothetical protein [Streptomonospora sp. PA3]